MTRERIVRLVAGTLVLTSLVLGRFLSPWWLLLAVFVGANLFQSSLTRWCLLEDILKKVGVKSDAEVALGKASTGKQG
jgi:hypothetical protein